MSDHRAKPGDLCKGDSFCRSYQYRTTWPLTECLHDKFFVTLRDYLFSGDMIRLVRFDGMNPAMSSINALETALVMVVNSGRLQTTVPLAIIEDIKIIGEQQPAAAPYRVEPTSKGKARLMKGDTMIQEYGSRSEADAEMQRLTQMAA